MNILKKIFLGFDFERGPAHVESRAYVVTLATAYQMRKSGDTSPVAVDLEASADSDTAFVNEECAKWLNENAGCKFDLDKIGGLPDGVCIWPDD